MTIFLPAPPAILLRVLLPFALGYLLSYLLRAVNAVAGPDLTAEFGLTASGLGFLTSAYLIGFSLFQLPIGVFLDRYGPRRVQAGLFGLAALGCAGFAVAQSYPTLVLARALIGLGFAAGLMASFKAIVLWVEPERRAFANASVMAFGGLGILLATEPTELLLGVVGWRWAFVGFGGLICAVAALIALTVPERPHTIKPEPLGRQFAELMDVLRSGPFWRAAPLLGLAAGTQIANQTLWAGNWFRDVMALSRADAARSLLWMALAFSAGILFSGVVADRLARRGIGPMAVFFGFFAIYAAAQAVIVAQILPLSFAAWLIVAATGQTAILGFPWLQRQFDPALAGRVNATLNLAMFIAAFGAQYAVGVIIDRFPSTANGYAPRAYGWAMGVILALQFLALAWYVAAPALTGRAAKGDQVQH